MPTDQADHLATMDRAARESGCGVPWQLLAAIARIESDFGRNMNTSTAGAIGYGQFLPSSWQAFGSDGNAYDYRDALPAIALYLCQSGLERDPRSALFAYNHADWYVDLVLDLAVEYDRMAPGAPTPDVLNVGPGHDTRPTLRYATGRDTRLQSRPRLVESSVKWLGVPWHGRAAGQPIASDAMQSTTLSMLRLSFGLKADAPRVVDAASSEHIATLAAAAWDAGLLALPGEGNQWTIAELRRHLSTGQSAVVFVGRDGLPGHGSGETGSDEQLLLLIGTTPDGFIYADPSFSSSLGYGLQLSDAELARVWDAAPRPRQALAFVARPRAASARAHRATAEMPEVVARVLPTASPTPWPAQPSPTPTALLASPTPIPTATATTTPAPIALRQLPAAPASRTDDSVYALLASVAGAVIVRRLRVGP